jgi:DNA (cytosine-5)-methyltransferase 1
VASRNEIRNFILRKRVRRGYSSLTAISLFSGAGISDLGYELAGFKVVVQSENDLDRANICEQNFTHSICIKGDINKTWKNIIKQYKKRAGEQRLSLLSITPPCQGMSSSNPGRGKITNPDHGVRDERNLLLLSAIPIINSLKPRIVTAENVPALLNRVIREKKTGKIKTVVQAFFDELINYVSGFITS